MIQWYEINSLLPTFDTPVILSKKEQQDYQNCRIGRLTLDDDKSFLGWFVDNDTQVITLGSRPYWTHLLEVDLTIVISEDDSISPYNVKLYLNKLSSLEQRIIQLGKAMLESGKGVYFLDYFVSGILSRSLSLLYAFQTLVESNNYVGAAHLIRPHLDNFLRLFATYIADCPHDIAKKVWQGTALDKLKDKDGMIMKDYYLKKKATELYPWIEKVYNETSGFIHFSQKHIDNTTKAYIKERKFQTYISKTDNDISIETKIEGIACMLEITNCIITHVYGWIETKRIKG